MLIFITTDIDHGIRLSIVGEKAGVVRADNVEDACFKLLRHLTKDDTAYVDTRGYGFETAAVLSRYISVKSVNLKPENIFSEDFD